MSLPLKVDWYPVAVPLDDPEFVPVIDKDFVFVTDPLLVYVFNVTFEECNAVGVGFGAGGGGHVSPVHG